MSLARNDRGQVAQRVVEMVWSERRELSVLAGSRPDSRPVIGECDLGLVWTELGQVVTPIQPPNFSLPVAGDT
jgi:hypothetical protein